MALTFSTINSNRVVSETDAPVFIDQFTDASSEPCEFCDFIPDNERSGFDVVVPMGTIALKPALGSLVPGYMLAVTKEHVTSFAQLAAQELDYVDKVMRGFEGVATPLFDEYLCFEHGSDNVESCGAGAGACVSHAHQHLVPAPQAAELMLAGLEWDTLDNMAQLTQYKGRPYMYMYYRGQHYAKAEPRLANGRPLPSQWGRRIVAEVTDAPVYDWALRADAVNLAETLLRLRHLPPGTLTLYPDADRLDYQPPLPGAPPNTADLIVIPQRATGEFPAGINQIARMWAEQNGQ